MSGLDYLHGVEVVEVEDGTRPIRTAKAGVIGVIGTSGKGPVNQAVLINGSRKKAAEIFGAYAADGFTLPEAFDGIFDHVGATVVAINVCDPATHITEVTGEALVLNNRGVGTTQKPYISAVTFDVTAATVTKTLVGGVAALAPNIILTSVKSADGVTTYTVDVDYTFDAGVLARVDGGALASTSSVLVTYSSTLLATDYSVDGETGEVSFSPTKVVAGSTLTVNYTHVDPTKVTLADIVGGIDGAGISSGVQVFNTAESSVFVTPRILIAPHFTHQKETPLTANPVVAELLGVANRLRAIIYADGPNTTNEDAVNYRKDWDSKRIVVLDPFVKVLAPNNEYVFQPRSIRRAGLAAQIINEQGFHVSPSNRQISGISGLARAVSGGLSDKNSEANYLNENEVATCIRLDGFREWGNRTASSDPKWAFESVVRTADMIQESILMAHLWAVDRNITKNLVGSIVESVNAYLRGLEAQGVILGGRCWADPELNTPESIMDGKLYIDFEFTPPYPAEHIIFRSHLVNNYITEVFATAA